MSFAPNVMKLIYQGKKPNALIDLVQLIDTYKCVTVAFLDQEIIDLQDKAIRNFIVKLEGIHYIEIMTYKIPGDRRVQLISRKGATFELAEVIKRHKATRKKRTIYTDIADMVMIYDIPFQVKYRNGREYDLINEDLDIRIGFYEKSIEEVTELMKITLRKMTSRKHNKLEKYLPNIDNYYAAEHKKREKRS